MDAISQTTVSSAIKTSLEFVPKGLINNILALVQIMAWRPPNDGYFTDECLRRSASTELYQIRKYIITNSIW